jgi:hypothetical protein
MLQLSFFKKPIVFASLLMLASACITRFSSNFYFPAEFAHALVFNIFIELATELVKLILITFCIVKLFQAQLTKKFIKTVTYYVLYIFSAFFIAVPIMLIGLNTWLFKSETATWISAYFRFFGGLPASISNVKQMPEGTIPNLILVIVLVGIILALFIALYFYIVLKISNKIASYFVDKQEKAA